MRDKAAFLSLVGLPLIDSVGKDFIPSTSGNWFQAELNCVEKLFSDYS